jgi:hypothetical protein
MFSNEASTNYNTRDEAIFNSFMMMKSDCNARLHLEEFKFTINDVATHQFELANYANFLKLIQG